MAYDFYLGKMLCPVAPSELQIKVNGHNKDLTLINGDEINIIKKKIDSLIDELKIDNVIKYDYDSVHIDDILNEFGSSKNN